MSSRAIGIIGGTFDPIHNGHLLAAACAADFCQLEQVIFVPASVPPHKRDRHITSEKQRYEMVLLATSDNPLFCVSPVEIERGGVSYTVDTLRYFKAQYPEHELYFITGTDTIPEINTWRSPEELLTLAHFVVAVRPGYVLHSLKGDFYHKNAERIVFLEMPGFEVSSTDIRHRLSIGATIKYQVHPLVEAYITKHNLYAKTISKES